MSTQAPSVTIDYPDSDGMPMADSLLQFRWITKLVGSLDAMFRDDPNVLVAGDFLWYPVEGDNTLRAAPDAMVVFGRPKFDRGSYMQWREEGIAPQVVFEVLSPGNRAGEMARKFDFYDRFGVEEYYVIDPEPNTAKGWRRLAGSLSPIDTMQRWVSPRLGIRFERIDDELRITDPHGRPFESHAAAIEQRDQAEQRAKAERQRAKAERQRAETALQLAAEERLRNERLLEKLRALGIDPDL